MFLKLLITVVGIVYFGECLDPCWTFSQKYASAPAVKDKFCTDAVLWTLVLRKLQCISECQHDGRCNGVFFNSLTNTCTGSFFLYSSGLEPDCQDASGNIFLQKVFQDCSKVVHGTTGQISGPSWPGEYQNSQTCAMVICAPSNTNVNLYFHSFELEHEAVCDYDYLEVRNGPETASPLISRFCGTTVPGPVKTGNNHVKLDFVADGSYTYTGFDLTWTSTAPECSWTYSGSTGHIYSPGWPGQYADNLMCQIIVTAPYGKAISFYFNSFAMEDHSTCDYDYLEIRNGSTLQSPVAAKLCGHTTPSPVFTPSSSVLLDFITDGSNTYEGFDITWTSTTPDCNRTYYGTSGHIYSPGWPGLYQHYLNCQMIIWAPSGSKVTLYFNTFDLEAETDCDYDYLEIRNGPHMDSPFLSKLCGETLPSPVYTYNDRVRLNFVTDLSIDAQGFDIRWTATTP